MPQPWLDFFHLELKTTLKSIQSKSTERLEQVSITSRVPTNQAYQAPHLKGLFVTGGRTYLHEDPPKPLLIGLSLGVVVVVQQQIQLAYSWPAGTTEEQKNKILSVTSDDELTVEESGIADDRVYEIFDAYSPDRQGL
jgi:hypothetical protein